MLKPERQKLATENAERAIATYPVSEESPVYAACDLIVDLLHYAAIKGENPDLLVERVLMHFRAEQAGED